MAWVAVTPKVPTEVAALGTSVVSTLNTLKSALEVVRLQTEVTNALVLASETKAVALLNTAIDSVLQAVNTTLDTLLDDAGLYVLSIPIPKKGLARLVADATTNGYNETAEGSSQLASNYIEFPITNIVSQGPEETQNRLKESKLINQILNPPDLLLGGNSYFVRTIMESMFDARDVNRPRFENSSYWAYAVMMAGASDLSSILQAAGFFDRLTGGQENANKLGTSRSVMNLVPAGVTVTASARNGSAIVSWDLVPASRTLRSFDHSKIIATKYAIIRSKDLRARTAQRVTDLFSTRELTEGLEGSYGAKVLAVKPYDGITTRFVDETVLEENQTYYYHVAFYTRVEPSLPPLILDPTTGGTQPVNPEAQPYDFGFDLLSTAQEFRRPSRREDYSRNALGTAPDWTRTPSIASLIPPLNRFLGQLQEYLNTLRSTATNAASQNDQILQFLNAEIARYTNRANEIERQIGLITSIFQAPSAGLYATLRTGSGPASTFLADVTQAFEDDSDAARPVFDNGDEFVTGIILLTVGPDPTRIAKAFSLLQQFFTSTSTEDPALTGINSINTQLAEIETALINQITGGTNSPGVSSVTFNADMTVRAPGQGDASCD